MTGDGEAWFTGEDTMSMKASTRNAQGQTGRAEGTMTFTGDDTLDWTWSERGPMGTMKIKGTSKRQR